MSLNETNILPSIEIDPSVPAKRSVIWLHGLGADGSDFVPVVPDLHMPETMGIRFIFPHAPIMPVTINNGYQMRAWYDISSLALDGKIDNAGITKSVTLLEKLIEQEVSRGVATNNIVLAGFSQGAVIALTTGINYSKPLAGIIALSGYLPLTSETFVKTNKANQHIPIFIAHGTEDPIVPYALGKATYAALKQANYPTDWHSYKMPHSVCAEEINDISKWMLKAFKE